MDLYKIDRLIKVTTSVLMALLFVMAIFFWEFLRNVEPMKRDNPAIPLYSIGDSSLSIALASGQQSVRLGPLFWGIIDGAPAFSSISEAQHWLAARSHLNGRVYLLAGDFSLDSADGKLSRTLVITRDVSAATQISPQ